MEIIKQRQGSALPWVELGGAHRPPAANASFVSSASHSQRLCLCGRGHTDSEVEQCGSLIEPVPLVHTEQEKSVSTAAASRFSSDRLDCFFTAEGSWTKTKRVLNTDTHSQQCRVNRDDSWSHICVCVCVSVQTGCGCVTDTLTGFVCVVPAPCWTSSSTAGTG